MDERKYMDYELAYKGYSKVKKILAEKGIEKVIEKFKDMCNFSYFENENVYFYYEDYNVCIDIDFDESGWFVNNNVEIVSYGGDFDNLDITSKDEIQYRLDNLLNFATTNSYSEEDYKKEKKSLESILKLL